MKQLLALSMLLLGMLGSAGLASATVRTAGETLCLNLYKSAIASATSEATACEAAASVHKNMAVRLRGKARQIELMQEAWFMYLAAKGELSSKRSNMQIGITELSRSRDIFQDVYDHAVDAETRKRGQDGMTTIDNTLTALDPKIIVNGRSLIME